MESQLHSDSVPKEKLFGASSSYSVDVESDQNFSSCCGPGEWIVCNCLSEGRGYVPYVPEENEREPDEADDLLDSSDNA